jgi:hypothetical protein
MDLRAVVEREFNRRQRNRRYSLRAFARQLGIHHSTLVRLRQGKRLTANTVSRLGVRLGLSARDIAAASAHEHAEILLALVRHPDFRPDCRWLAVMTGLNLDEVNITLHRLIASRRLTLAGRDRWIEERAS